MRTKPELTAAIHEVRRAVLLVNAHSRRGRRLYPEVLRRARRRPASTCSAAFPVDGPRELADHAWRRPPSSAPTC